MPPRKQTLVSSSNGGSGNNPDPPAASILSSDPSSQRLPNKPHTRSNYHSDRSDAGQAYQSQESHKTGGNSTNIKHQSPQSQPPTYHQTPNPAEQEADFLQMLNVRISKKRSGLLSEEQARNERAVGGRSLVSVSLPPPSARIPIQSPPNPLTESTVELLTAVSDEVPASLVLVQLPPVLDEEGMKVNGQDSERPKDHHQSQALQHDIHQRSMCEQQTVFTASNASSSSVKRIFSAMMTTEVPLGLNHGPRNEEPQDSSTGGLVPNGASERGPSLPSSQRPNLVKKFSQGVSQDLIPSSLSARFVTTSASQNRLPTIIDQDDGGLDDENFNYMQHLGPMHDPTRHSSSLSGSARHQAKSHFPNDSSSSSTPHKNIGSQLNLQSSSGSYLPKRFHEPHGDTSSHNDQNQTSTNSGILPAHIQSLSLTTASGTTPSKKLQHQQQLQPTQPHRQFPGQIMTKVISVHANGEAISSPVRHPNTTGNGTHAATGNYDSAGSPPRSTSSAVRNTNRAPGDNTSYYDQVEQICTIVDSDKSSSGQTTPSHSHSDFNRHAPNIITKNHRPQPRGDSPQEFDLVEHPPALKNPSTAQGHLLPSQQYQRQQRPTTANPLGSGITLVLNYNRQGYITQMTELAPKQNLHEHNRVNNHHDAGSITHLSNEMSDSDPVLRHQPRSSHEINAGSGLLILDDKHFLDSDHHHFGDDNVNRSGVLFIDGSVGGNSATMNGSPHTTKLGGRERRHPKHHNPNNQNDHQYSSPVHPGHHDGIVIGSNLALSNANAFLLHSQHHNMQFPNSSLNQLNHQNNTTSHNIVGSTIGVDLGNASFNQRQLIQSSKNRNGNQSNHLTDPQTGTSVCGSSIFSNISRSTSPPATNHSNSKATHSPQHNIFGSPSTQFKGAHMALGAATANVNFSTLHNRNPNEAFLPFSGMSGSDQFSRPSRVKGNRGDFPGTSLIAHSGLQTSMGASFPAEGPQLIPQFDENEPHNLPGRSLLAPNSNPAIVSSPTVGQQPLLSTTESMCHLSASTSAVGQTLTPTLLQPVVTTSSKFYPNIIQSFDYDNFEIRILPPVSPNSELVNLQQHHQPHHFATHPIEDQSPLFPQNRGLSIPHGELRPQSNVNTGQLACETIAAQDTQPSTAFRPTSHSISQFPSSQHLAQSIRLDPQNHQHNTGFDPNSNLCDNLPFFGMHYQPFDPMSQQQTTIFSTQLPQYPQDQPPLQGQSDDYSYLGTTMNDNPTGSTATVSASEYDSFVTQDHHHHHLHHLQQQHQHQPQHGYQPLEHNLLEQDGHGNNFDAAATLKDTQSFYENETIVDQAAPYDPSFHDVIQPRQSRQAQNPSTKSSSKTALTSARLKVLSTTTSRRTRASAALEEERRQLRSSRHGDQDENLDVEDEEESDNGGEDGGDADAQRYSYRNNQQQRTRLPLAATLALRQWFLDHLEYPYLSATDKDQLSEELDLSKTQIGNWINNCRKRVYLPLCRQHGIDLTFGSKPSEEVKEQIRQLRASLPEDSFVGLL